MDRIGKLMGRGTEQEKDEFFASYFARALLVFASIQKLEKTRSGQTIQAQQDALEIMRKIR